MIVDAILTTVYWSSFAYIGLNLLPVLERRWKSTPISKDPLIRLFIGICLGFAIFTPLALLGYAFSLPIEPVAFLWLAIFIWFLDRFRFGDELKALFNTIKNSKYLWLWVAVLSTDYAVSLYLGGYFSGDAWGHMARINDILQNGFTIYDPYFPNLIDMRANASLSHALYAAGGFLTGLDSIFIWYYSLAFFRFVMALGVYVVMKLISNSRLLSTMVSMVTIVALSFEWRFIQYPNKLARLWLIFIALGLIRLLNNPKDKLGIVMLISGSVMSTMTHPVFSAGIAGLVSLALLIHLILSKGWKNLANYTSRYTWILVSIPVLIITTVIGMILPARTGFSLGDETQLAYFLGIEIMSPDYAYSILYVLIAISLITFTFRKKRSLAFKSVFVATLALFPLIAFTPVFDLAREYLTPRIISRYKSDTNLLAYNITVPTLVLITSYVGLRKVNRFKKYSEIALIVLSLFLIVIYHGNARRYFGNQRGLRNDALNYIEKIKNSTEEQEFRPGELLIAKEGVSYIAGSFLNIDAIKIPHGHAPRNLDRDQRAICVEELLSEDPTVRLGAINALQPDYYLIDNSLLYLSDAPELELINTGTHGFRLFKVNDSLIKNNYVSESCMEISKGNA